MTANLITIKNVLFYTILWFAINYVSCLVHDWHKRLLSNRKNKQVFHIKASVSDSYGPEWFAMRKARLALSSARTNCKHRDIIITPGEPTLGNYVNCRLCGTILTDDAIDSASIINYR